MKSRIERLLNYKRYIDFLIERELKHEDKRKKTRSTQRRL